MSILSDILRRLTQKLYPTGRVWTLKLNSIFQKFHEGLSISEEDAILFLKSNLNAILPDNDAFTEEDALNWERTLGLYQQPYLTLEERKTIILRKYNYPNNILNRGHWQFVQEELRSVGFDVYIHENRFDNGGTLEVFDPRGANYGDFFYGNLNYAQSDIAGGYEICANYVDKNIDNSFNIGPEVNLRATFFVGGLNFGDRVSIDSQRQDEFREMILKLKHAQTVGILLIDYVNTNVLAEFTDGTPFDFTDNTQLEFTNT